MHTMLTIVGHNIYQIDVQVAPVNIPDGLEVNTRAKNYMIPSQFSYIVNDTKVISA